MKGLFILNEDTYIYVDDVNFSVLKIIKTMHLVRNKYTKIHVSIFKENYIKMIVNKSFKFRLYPN